LVVYKGKLGKALKKKSVYKERGMRKEWYYNAFWKTSLKIIEVFHIAPKHQDNYGK
jgi:hypothetical protein